MIKGDAPETETAFCKKLLGIKNISIKFEIISSNRRVI